VKDSASERLGQFYEQYFSRVYGYVRYKVNDLTTAEDLTASVFMRLVERFDGLRRHEEEALVRWVFTTAHNMVIDHYRTRRERLSLETLIEGGWQPQQEENPEQDALRQDTLTSLRQRLGELSEREQDIIGLKFVSQLTNRQIAGVTGLSEANVAQILHRALRRIRERLKEGEKA